ncbi:LAME_0H13894g1_1 [Lachancea meyersii CBS 8951]|uniref:LAME_0H13894g1_1 n=1 Tax=Lachancea meyersii CBS 8951 TaxID=1266667 RepID=A0A1G4KH40_9SACH|nr:LAME_0H13894g1_1 [Lachancea meyersii CBS 8951]
MYTPSILRHFVALILFFAVGTRLCEAAPSRSPYYPKHKNATQPSKPVGICANLTSDFPDYYLSNTEKAIEYLLQDASKYIQGFWNQYEAAKKSQDILSGFESYLHFVSLQDTKGDLIEDVVNDTDHYFEYINTDVLDVVGEKLSKKKQKQSNDNMYSLVVGVLNDSRPTHGGH